MLSGLRRFLETWNTSASTGTSQSAPTRSDCGGRQKQKHHQLDLQEESSGVALLLWQQCKPAFAGEQFVSGFAVVLFAGNFLQQQGTDRGRVTASIYSVGLTVKCNSKLGLKHIYIISLLSF